jgi:hypothetical protein
MILFWEAAGAVFAAEVRLICPGNLKDLAIDPPKSGYRGGSKNSGTPVATSYLEAGCCPVSRQEAAMRIVGVGGSINSAPAARRGASEAHERQAPEAGSRALIALKAPAPSERTPRMTRHPAVGFLAQLIATRMQAPQTRARRRAEPEEAIAVYRSMTKPVAQRRSFGTRA